MEVFRFAHPEYLWLLVFIPVSLLLFLIYMYWRSKVRRQFGEDELVKGLMIENPRHKYQVKYILFALAFACIAVGLANPQLGTKFEKVKRQGVDVIIALDVSKSMLAEDVKPNRLERSKQLISNLIDKLSNDRIGLIVFAGNAYLQMPITVDYSAARIFLKTVDTDMVPTQGTAIAEAIRLANESFDAGETKHKALVIITDGENHEGELEAALDEAVTQGVIIHTVGVGSSKGAPIPVNSGSYKQDFKRDKEGNIVLSKLDETMLQQIALNGNGEYFRFTGGNEQINQIVNTIGQMETKEMEERVFTDYEDQFQYFLLAAILLLTLEFFISDRKSRWLSDWSLFKT